MDKLFVGLILLLINMTYFNTTSLVGPDLFTAIDNCITQDQLILNHFKKYPNNLYSPCDCWKILFDDNTPCTSIRRSISSLTAEGKLIKTDQYKTGVYGKKVYLWKLSI